MLSCRMDLSHSGDGLGVASCDYSNGTFGSIKLRILLLYFLWGANSTVKLKQEVLGRTNMPTFPT
jgi:hypothetical protein